jgi:hypothetical protein
MDERTLEALKGSIAKWEAIVAGTGLDGASDNCPLCHIFHPDFSNVECDGCPVYERTDNRYCGNTPYVEWVKAGGRKGVTVSALGDAGKLAAQAELDFLRSLLPAEAVSAS